MNTSQASAALSLTHWKEINWNGIQRYVKKLRQRIFRAEQLDQHRKVKKLQRLMLRSQANLLLSIKKVTQINKGKRTAGVDGYKAINHRERLRLFHKMSKQHIRQHHPKPARRIYISKKTEN